MPKRRPALSKLIGLLACICCSGCSGLGLTRWSAGLTEQTEAVVEKSSATEAINAPLPAPHELAMGKVTQTCHTTAPNSIAFGKIESRVPSRLPATAEGELELGNQPPRERFEPLWLTPSAKK